MCSVLMLSAVLAAPPMGTAAEASPEKPRSEQVQETLSPPTLEEVREAYVQALRKSDRRAQPKPPEVVPALVEVYGDLETVADLSHAERSRMQGVVKARLEQMRNKMIREVLRNKKLADRRLRRSQPARSSPPADEKAAMLAGGGANARAIQLIDLIQNTIEPDSWQRVGGKGSISYFDLLQVLVVRQTGEVHHQLGGALGQLRK